MQVREISCKSILTRTTGYLKGVCSHSANPYVGCGFGLSACGVGCYVRFNPWLTRGREWGRFVDVKVGSADAYRRDAQRERDWAIQRGLSFAIFLSSSTDPWQPLEKKYRVTRSLLTAMREFPPDTLILQTHGSGIRDDLPLIRELSRVCRLRVHISIEGDTDRLPGLPPPPCSLEERLAVVEEFAHAGMQTVACLSPLYPLRDAEAFFADLSARGASAVVIDHFIEGDGTPDGARTRQTALPQAMALADPASTHLAYRDAVAAIARKHLPVGISCRGFAGDYAPVIR
jgi:DNA repair photolyase